jgi:signal transduction histidine kinase
MITGSQVMLPASVAPAPPATPHRISKRTVLRAGYGAMLILLLASALEAYRIQQRASAQNQEIYRRYTKQQDALYRVRRILYLGGIHARDLLLSTAGDRVNTYRSQLATLDTEAHESLNLLDLMPPAGDDTSELRRRTEEYVKLLATLAEWPEKRWRLEGMNFIQKELVPRRNTAGEIARDWIKLSESALEASERDFTSSRQTAGTRLVIILGACWLVGCLVMRFSLKHADNLEREGARQFEEVVRAKYELQHLSARLLEIQENERKRLSRELHDEIGQTLTALRIEISHAHALVSHNGPAARERLERARDLAERTVRTVRDISLLLRPSLLDDLGLSPALQSLAEEFTRRTNTPCELHEEGVRETLPDVVKTCVYRVVQEALNNVQKHAAARSVRIHVQQAATELTVQVVDDGRGWVATGSEGVRAGKLGILGMRERASILGGSLVFQSTPGVGSTIELRVPVEPSHEPARVFQEIPA